MYLAYMGKGGMRAVAELCYHRAHYAAAEISKLPSYQVLTKGAFFNEFVVQCPQPVAQVNKALLRRASWAVTTWSRTIPTAKARCWFA